jgi:nucleotide-binding universal stress UspA family protein
MMKILITTDFSENSLNAAKFAISMFGVKDVHYSLVNTYTEPRAVTTVVVSLNDFLRKESIEGVTKQKELLLSLFDGLKIESHTYYGAPANTIKNLSQEMEVDYVVMGTKGASSVENFLIGSNTLEVIKEVNVPIVMIPLNCEYNGMSKLAIASDLHKLNHSHLIDPLVRIAKQHDSEICVLNVHTNETNYNEAIEGFELHNQLEDVNHSFHSEINPNVVEGIENFVYTKKVDLLAIVARRHTFFERIFTRSVTKELSKLAHFPMLILHE